MPKYDPGIVGSATATTTNKLVDSTKNFTSFSSLIGKVVKNLTDNTSALITAVDSPTTLSINSDIFVISETYSISNGVTEDFFLVECIDWMLYQTIRELNLFLKEDQRIQISNAIMKEAWDTVVSWNSRLKTTDDELDLD
jgi:hypothetical protein